ncbi:MFS transporter [Pseudonocardia acaciae]|uniref:MFS transporter n=1 Tax=Pseudonocardia acaciae TaxID=551276 RepID=UPI00048ADC8A|nr:MFS transporter [Pseudonocardia acaciae]
MTENGAVRAAGRREWIGLATLALATLMITFEMFALLLALPKITEELRPSAAQQLWIVDVYGFMVGGLLITMGTLGDRVGRRKVLMVGAAGFAAASLVCAFATSADMLILGRALLGVAGSTLAPSTLALIRNMFPDPRQMGLAVGVWAGGFTLGAILGLVVGGVMLAHLWWGSTFLLAVPVMALLLVLCPVFVAEHRGSGTASLDVIGALLSVVTMIALSYGLKEITRHGWRPVPILVGLAGVGIGAVFVRRQLRGDHPLLDLRLFANRSFSTMLVGLVLYALIGASGLFYLTQFLQSVSGMTPLASALCLLPGMAVAAASGILSPLLARRIRPAYLISGGLVGMAAAYAMFSRLDASSGPGLVMLGFAVTALGEGPLLTLGTSLVVASAPPDKAGSSASMTQVANEAGASLGVAVMGSIGAAVYVGRLDDTAPEGLAGDALAGARESVAGAVAAASDLPAQLGAPLVAAAREAFVSGMNVFATVSVGILLLAAVVIAARLRHVPPTGRRAASSVKTGS